MSTAAAAIAMIDAYRLAERFTYVSGKDKLRFASRRQDIASNVRQVLQDDAPGESPILEVIDGMQDRGNKFGSLCRTFAGVQKHIQDFDDDDVAKLLENLSAAIVMATANDPEWAEKLPDFPDGWRGAMVR